MNDKLFALYKGMSKFITKTKHPNKLVIDDINFFLKDENESDSLVYDVHVNPESLPEFYTIGMITSGILDILESAQNFFKPPIDIITEKKLNKLYIGDKLFYEKGVKSRTDRFFSKRKMKLIDKNIQKYEKKMDFSPNMFRSVLNYSLSLVDNSIELTLDSDSQGMYFWSYITSKSILCNNQKIDLENINSDEIKRFMFNFNDLSESNYITSDYQQILFDIIRDNNDLLSSYFEYFSLHNTLILTKIGNIKVDEDTYRQYSPQSDNEINLFLKKYCPTNKN